MKYRWTTCPNCHCEISINYVETPTGLLGSTRRWNHDRTINDGKPFEVPAAQLTPEGGFVVECRCGQKLEVPARPDATSAGREEDFRVKL